MPDQCPLKRTPAMETLPFRDDRTTAWELLRAAGDVSVSEQGVYFLTSADAVEAAAKQPEIFSSQGAFAALGSPIPLVPIAFDPPEHSRYRRMLDKFFSPRHMAEIAPQLRTQLGELIDGILAGGESCDIVSTLAVPYPSQVFLTLFGLPLEDRDKFIAWKDAILQMTDAASADASPELLQQAGELFAFLSEHIAARRDNHGSDLLSQILADRDDGGMTDQEVLGLCFLFVIAGLDTVTAAVGLAFSALAQDPARRGRITNQSGARLEFIEELLRVDGPVLGAPRMTTQDVEIGDVTIPSGSSCVLSFGAANHDPNRYDDPNRMHDTRNNHFAFGRGPHRCLGSHLARLELQLVLEEWHQRIPDYHLTNAHVPQAIWPNSTLTLERVDLTFGKPA